MGVTDYKTDKGLASGGLHRLLQRQVNKFLNAKSVDITQLQDFISAVNDAYRGFEEDHKHLERTLEVSSNELFKANAELKETKQNLEKIVEERTKKLAESEILFRSLVETSYDLITILEPDGTFKYESPSVGRILGYDPAELFGNNCMDYIHPEDTNKVSATMQKLYETPGEAASQEFRFKNKDGEYIWLESIGKYVNDNSYVTGLVVNSRDITERYIAQEKINIQSRILDTISANMPISIYTLDKQGCFMSCKGTALAPVKYGKTTIIGHSIYDILPDKREEIEAALAGNVVHFTWSVMYNNNEYFFENFIFPDEVNADAALVGFALDVTKEKQHENKLKDYYESLERINGELDQYAYIVSHDLKAPLRAINNLSEWIEEELGDAVNDDAAKNFELMRGRIRRMEMLINGILEYSKAGRQRHAPEEFSINDMVSEIISAIAPSASYKFEVQQAMPVLIADRIKIEQVFSNYISNAIKYNDNPEPVIHVGYNDTPTHYHFYVKDNGPGIEADYHDKVFAIFQTLNARDKVESTGVGLAIVKKIVEEAGGTVWIESEPGHGAAFFFSLPKRH